MHEPLLLTLSRAPQIIAVQRSGKKWLARRLGHGDMALAAEQVARSDQQSLSFTQLEETRGLLWIETDSPDSPQDLRSIVPNRPVRWGMQIVACDADSVQALVPTPLAGARRPRAVHACVPLAAHPPRAGR